MRAQTLEILSNTEVIAVDQDPIGKAGTRVGAAGTQEVWARELADGGRAVALLNRGGASAMIRVDFAAIGAPATVAVRDLWAHRERGIFAKGFSVTLPPHGSGLYLVWLDTPRRPDVP